MRYLWLLVLPVLAAIWLWQQNDSNQEPRSETNELGQLVSFASGIQQWHFDTEGQVVQQLTADSSHQYQQPDSQQLRQVAWEEFYPAQQRLQGDHALVEDDSILITGNAELWQQGEQELHITGEQLHWRPSAKELSSTTFVQINLFPHQLRSTGMRLNLEQRTLHLPQHQESRYVIPAP